MNAEITVKVLVPGSGVNYVLPVIVRGCDQVSSLDFQFRNQELVFKGQLLEQQSTFADYNIQNNGTIKAEVARLRDTRLRKAEGNPSRLRRM
jgi:hypothetical protein